MAVARDPALADRMRRLRSHGIVRDPALMSRTPDGPWYYEQIELGFNYRMTDIQAALGLSQLARLDAFLARRREIAARYDAAFAALPVMRQAPQSDALSAHHLYVIRVSLGARTRLKGWGVPITAVIWVFVALHVLGWGDAVITALDSIGINAGKTRISVWSVLKLLVTVSVFVIAAMYASRWLERRVLGLDASTHGVAMITSSITASRHMREKTAYVLRTVRGASRPLPVFVSIRLSCSTSWMTSRGRTSSKTRPPISGSTCVVSFWCSMR
jgi:hypothetical protein